MIHSEAASQKCQKLSVRCGRLVLMETNVAVDMEEQGKSWILTALWSFLGFNLLQYGYRKLVLAPWWQDPSHRELLLVVVFTVFATGVAVGTMYLGRAVLLSLFNSLSGTESESEASAPVETSVEEPVAVESVEAPASRELSDRAERLLIAALVARFQKDVFQLLVELGQRKDPDRDLPEAMQVLRQAPNHLGLTEWVWKQARSRLNNRLDEARRKWDISAEALERLERDVHLGGQILLTCQTSIKSWQ